MAAFPANEHVAFKHANTHTRPQTHAELFPSFQSGSLGVRDRLAGGTKAAVTPTSPRFQKKGGRCLAAERHAKEPSARDTRKLTHPLPKTNPWQ